MQYVTLLSEFEEYGNCRECFCFLSLTCFKTSVGLFDSIYINLHSINTRSTIHLRKQDHYSPVPLFSDFFFISFGHFDLEFVFQGNGKCIVFEKT